MYILHISHSTIDQLLNCKWATYAAAHDVAYQHTSVTSHNSTTDQAIITTNDGHDGRVITIHMYGLSVRLDLQGTPQTGS